MQGTYFVQVSGCLKAFVDIPERPCILIDGPITLTFTPSTQVLQSGQLLAPDQGVLGAAVQHDHRSDPGMGAGSPRTREEGLHDW